MLSSSRRPTQALVLPLLGVFIMGFALGSISERRGWSPSFRQSQSPAIEAALARSSILQEENLRTLNDVNRRLEGIGGETIVVFMNYECQYCALFDSTLVALARDGRYRVQFHHVVSKRQESAYRKHRLAECAVQHGASMLDVSHALYQLPRTSNWSADDVIGEYLPDSVATSIDLCIDGDSPTAAAVDRILESDSVLVSKLGITSTPSWIVGQRMGVGAIAQSSFDAVFRALNDG